MIPASSSSFFSLFTSCSHSSVLILERRLLKSSNALSFKSGKYGPSAIFWYASIPSSKDMCAGSPVISAISFSSIWRILFSICSKYGKTSPGSNSFSFRRSLSSVRSSLVIFLDWLIIFFISCCSARFFCDSNRSWYGVKSTPSYSFNFSRSAW